MKNLLLVLSVFVLGVSSVFGQEFSSKKHIKIIREEVKEYVYVQGDIFNQEIKFSSAPISFMGGAGICDLSIIFYMKKDSTVSPMYIKFKYKADDWLFVESMILYDKHNDNRLTLIYKNPNTKVLSGGSIKEWGVVSLNEEARYFLYGYANGKKTRALHIKISGDKTYTTGIAMYNSLGVRIL